MSKVICDVCGTSYAETATQCPICGCARTELTGVISDSRSEDSAGEYTYVKGGRFSKANVKKRNLAMQTGSGAELPRTSESDNANNKWLIAIAVVLIAAIIAVVLFIILHFAGIGGNQPAQPSTEPSSIIQTDAPTEPSEESTEPSEIVIACTDLELVKADISLTVVGEAYQLEVSVLPADTTDAVTFTSADESVVTVDADGKVTAVGTGETVITITCGQISKECKVVCTLEPDVPVPPSFLLKLNRSDFTLSSKGSTWDLYDDDALLEASYITWTSENAEIATVENGIVTATGSGTTKIHAKLEEQEVTCIVRCEFPSHNGSGGVTEEGSGTVSAYQISHEDVTLRLSSDNSFRLVLKDSDGNTVDVTWTVTDPSICAVSGNKVTALKAGTTKVKVTLGGETYSCIVRVYE